MASSTPVATSPVNLLAYLRSVTSVDVDCLDVKVATELGPFADCTSNQWEAYGQLCDPPNAALLSKSAGLARQLQDEYKSVSYEELAVEIAMISLSLRMVPMISGAIHVMCNPLYSWDTDKVFETGHRFHTLCRNLDPDFDLSRLIMKVPATWEGLQACRRLKTDGVKTLATTLFTMEQAILAGEAGCISISPFAHELRAHLGTSYRDAEPVLALFLEAQLYYRRHNIPTKVKSCAFTTVEEILATAGVDAMTLPGEQLQELASSPPAERESLDTKSVFHNAQGKKMDASDPPSPPLSYIDNKTNFNRAYTTNGRGRAKTEDSIAVFCGFQIQAEALVAMAELN